MIRYSFHILTEGESGYILQVKERRIPEPILAIKFYGAVFRIPMNRSQCRTFLECVLQCL